MTTSNPQDNKGSEQGRPPADGDLDETRIDTVSDMPTVSLPGVESSGPAAEAPQIEGYEIIEELGRGAMGAVWLAVQLSTHRKVALKLLGSNMGEKDRLRFEREVSLCARLAHPGIARVYDSGLCRGSYYYAMELVDGLNMEQYVKGSSLDQAGILRLVESTARAVQHAHQRGVIHRDLKPSNVMVSSDGQPHVVDFGLARTFLSDDECIEVSVDGSVAGTPAFMAPEQAAGRINDLDTRTDAYSLGVILFYLLAGEFPRSMSGRQYEILARIADEDVIRPRSICENIDSELEAILLKAMALKPDDRYASAGEFANDIDNYLTGEPLLARRPTLGYFLKKRIVKHRGRVAAAGTLVLALIFGVVFYIHSIRHERDQTERARKVAVMQRLVAEANEREAVRQKNLVVKTFKSFVYEAQPVLASKSAPLKLRGGLIDLVLEQLDDIGDIVGTLDTESDRLKAVTSLISGHVAKYSGDAVAARKRYAVALNRFKYLAGLNPKAYSPNRELEIAHAAMAQMNLLAGLPDKAAEHLNSALEIVDDLKKAFPDKSNTLADDRWTLLIAMAQAKLETGDPKASMKLLAEATELVGPHGGMQQAETLRSMGKAQLALDNSTAARQHYDKALAIEAARAKASPKTRGPRQGLTECRRQLAAIDLSAGDLTSARENCRGAVESAKWLTTQDPDRISGWGYLAKALHVSGLVETGAKEYAESAIFIQQCVNILTQLGDKGKLEGFKEYQDLFKKARRDLGAAQRRKESHRAQD